MSPSKIKFNVSKILVHWMLNKKIATNVIFTIFLQHFHNKTYAVSFYWFNLNLPLKLFFFTNNNLLYRICYKNIVKIAFFAIFFVQYSMDQNFREVEFYFWWAQLLLKVFKFFLFFILGWSSFFLGWVKNSY